MANKESSSILTTKEFWENEWKDLKLPIVLDKNSRADRSFMNLYDKYLSKDSSLKKSSLEIGCNPGKFTIYCGKNLNYDISGVDYDEKGCVLSKKNIEAAGILGSIINQNIFDLKVENKFDLVISHGFIEHFSEEKLEEVLKIHVDLLNDDGKLFISVPNFRYLNFIFAYLFRRKLLDHHNLSVMQKSFFEDIANKYNLKINYIGYFGGIHPGGLKFNKINIFKKLISSMESFKLLDKINSKYFSHHVGAIFTKN
jgi:2-polyprenyl-3-methyl-5-hydroxy-6-metoxy-1,4-benzoquinol methylase